MIHSASPMSRAGSFIFKSGVRKENLRENSDPTQAVTVVGLVDQPTYKLEFVIYVNWIYSLCTYHSNNINDVIITK